MGLEDPGGIQRIPKEKPHEASERMPQIASKSPSAELPIVIRETGRREPQPQIVIAPSGAERRPEIITMSTGETPQSRKDPAVAARRERVRTAFSEGKDLEEIAAMVGKTTKLVESDIYKDTDPQARAELIIHRRIELGQETPGERQGFVVNEILEHPLSSHAEIAERLGLESSNQVSESWHSGASQEQRKEVAAARKIEKQIAKVTTDLAKSTDRPQPTAWQLDIAERDAHIVNRIVDDPRKTHAAIAEGLGETEDKIDERWNAVATSDQKNAAREARRGRIDPEVEERRQQVVAAITGNPTKEYKELSTELGISVGKIKDYWHFAATEEQKMSVEEARRGRIDPEVEKRRQQVIKAILKDPLKKYQDIGEDFGFSAKDIAQDWSLAATEEQKENLTRFRNLAKDPQFEEQKEKVTAAVLKNPKKPYEEIATELDMSVKDVSAYWEVGAGRDNRIIHAVATNPLTPYASLAEDLDVTESQIKQAWYSRAPQEVKTKVNAARETARKGNPERVQRDQEKIVGRRERVKELLRTHRLSEIATILGEKRTTIQSDWRAIQKEQEEEENRLD